jgi:heptosyltransferase II
MMLSRSRGEPVGESLTLWEKVVAESKKYRIGVFMPTWVGDAVMATPTLRTLRSSFPASTIIGVMRPVIHDLLAGTNNIDEVIQFDKRRGRGLLNRLQMIRTLRRAKLDSMLLLTNSLWTAAVSKLAGISRIVGYNRDARGWLLTDKVAIPHRQQADKRQLTPAIDYYLRIGKQIGCETSDRRVQLAVTDSESSLADVLWQQLGFRVDRQTVVINSNSATEKSRLWPADKVKALALQLANQRSTQVLLHCGPAERELANQLATESDHPLVASMGMAQQLPIGLSKAVLSRADAVVSTDSGPRHIAVALDRHVISLFGPTTPSGTLTYNVPETLLSAHLDCRPCYASSCSQKHGACMQAIEVDQVFRAVCEALSNTSRSSGLPSQFDIRRAS